MRKAVLEIGEESEDGEPEDQFAKYFDVYAKHEKCIAEESKVAAEDNGGGEDENMEVDEIVIIPDDFMGRSFLKKACKVLKESRCCLMYSCVYAYNLTFKTAKSTFRENMDCLQSSVENLCEFLEADVQKLSDDEKSREMKGVVEFCDNRRKTNLSILKNIHSRTFLGIL